MSESHITISVEEYKRLKKDSEWLGYLESAGVDNWDGYEFAHELARDDGWEDD